MSSVLLLAAVGNGGLPVRRFNVLKVIIKKYRPFLNSIGIHAMTTLVNLDFSLGGRALLIFLLVLLQGCKSIPVTSDVDLSHDNWNEIDVTSKPSDILSSKRQNELWNAYKTASTCMSHPVYAEDLKVNLRVFSDAVFLKNTWQSPFSPIATDDSPIGIGIESPNPIVEIKLNEAYGERQSKVENSQRWFAAISKRILETSNAELSNFARSTLLLWAEKDALSSGIHVSWGSRPVDWQVMTLIGSILTTTAVVGEGFQADERVKVGHWLNRLMWNVAQSRWGHRIDNKALMRSYYVMLWGLMIGDMEAVQNSVDHFKKSIHDIRPDGSFPIDTQRSGMGLKYNADAAGFMVMMAVLSEFGMSKNLHLYSVEGRSLATIVEFVTKAVIMPVETNQIYAIPCPSSGDRWGSVSMPSTSFIGNSAFLKTYLLLDSNHPQATLIKSKYRWDIVQSETLTFLSDKIFQVRKKPSLQVVQ